MIDLSKLSPAPWVSDKDADIWHGSHLIFRHTGCNEDDADFCALARNAFDVMMRRGWNVYKEMDGWSIGNDSFLRGMGDCDPFTALVEADKWYAENIERKTASGITS